MSPTKQQFEAKVIIGEYEILTFKNPRFLKYFKNLRFLHLRFKGPQGTTTTTTTTTTTATTTTTTIITTIITTTTT